MERREPKKRQRRSDSATAAVKATQNAALGPHDPPAHIKLPKSAMPYWISIMGARARDRWLPIDLANAAELAMLYDDMARLRGTIRKQGDMLENGNPHPAHRLLDTAGRRAIALSRMLHVHPEATEGRSRDAGNSGALERAAAGGADSIPDNVRRLIPRVSRQ